MSTHCKTRYHIISIAYISLMIILIALGVVVYLQQYASADYLRNSAGDTTAKSVES